MEFVRVAEYRNRIDHLFRIHNVDRNACVSTQEAKAHVEIASRICAELEATGCKRARKKDHDNRNRVIGVVSKWLETADQWADERSERHGKFALGQRERRES